MDTENFLIRRRLLAERLEDRRARVLTPYFSKKDTAFGIQIPVWMRLAFKLLPSSGLLSSVIQIGLPLASAFLIRQRTPFLGRLLGHFLPSKS